MHTTAYVAEQPQLGVLLVRNAIRDGRLQASLAAGRTRGHRIAATTVGAWLTGIARRTGRAEVTIPRHPRGRLAVIALSLTLAACGDQQASTVTQPAGEVPLGRPLGPSDPPARSPGGPSARSAARAFLTSYLQISYGHAELQTLRRATPALRSTLRAQAARVPPGVRARQPRITALELRAIQGGQLRAMATVDDGDIAPYLIFATLARRDGRWQAVALGGE